MHQFQNSHVTNAYEAVGIASMIERREDTRRRVCLGGMIETATFLPETPCMVRNVSLAGAQVRVCFTAILPERMVLHVPVRGERRVARVAWREGEWVGLRFEAAGDAPPPPEPRREAATDQPFVPTPPKGRLH
jgi:hypothetical protein